MNRKITGFLCVIILGLLLMNIPMFQAYAAPEPTISVEPELNMFSTEDTSVGDNFTVNVNVADFVDPGLYAYEFKLKYDNTLLKATAWALPEGHFLTPAEGEMPIYLVPASGIYQEDGYVLVAITLQGDAVGKTGAGTMATVTFEITQAPSPTEAVSCDLELRELVFADPEIEDIVVTPEHGYYEFSPPKPSVYLSVEPSIAGAVEVGDEVVVAIMINEVEEEIRLIAVQWRLYFNTTLLSVTDVTEGGFFKNWAETAGLNPDDVFFWWLQEDDYAVSFTIYAEFVENPPTVFPEGSGTLATITFNATYKPETGRATCDLLLDEEFVLLLDIDENVIPYHHLEHGGYQMPIKPGDLNMDGKVDILDIGIFAKAYGSYPGHPRWDPFADLVRDKSINILDVVTIAKNFGS